MKSRVDLTGKIALVTGASGGLGQEFSRELAESGATVILASRRLDLMQEVADEINDKGGKAMPLVMDVLDKQSIKEGFDEIEKQFGTVNVLVNNAGVTVSAKAINISDDDWDTVIGTNLTACWRIAKETAERLIKAEQSGSIINIASVLSHRVTIGVLPYAVSKAGLAQMTRVLSLEWARHNIRVNAIAPGYIDTPINSEYFSSEAGQKLRSRIPMKRVGQPKELRAALLMLANDDDSSFMTGSVISIDGGHQNLAI